MNSLSKPLNVGTALHSRFVRIASHIQPAALLALRVTWGWQLLESGYGHLTHVQKTIDAFRSWGVPFPQLNVYISGSTELIGGLLLVLGLGARLIAVPLIFNFLVAYATASHDTVSQLFTGPARLDAYDGVINDAAFPMLMLALLTLAFGPGAYSLDALVRKYLLPLAFKRASAPVAGQRSGASTVTA